MSNKGVNVQDGEWRKGGGALNHTDPNKMSLSASFPGAASTSSVLPVVVVVDDVDILANCSAAFLSLDKVVRLLLTASVIRTGGKIDFSFPFFFEFTTSFFLKQKKNPILFMIRFFFLLRNRL